MGTASAVFFAAAPSASAHVAGSPPQLQVIKTVSSAYVEPLQFAVDGKVISSLTLLRPLSTGSSETVTTPSSPTVPIRPRVAISPASPSTRPTARLPTPAAPATTRSPP